MEHLPFERIDYLAIFGSIAFLLFVGEMVRKRRIREEYSLLWFIFGIVFLALSLWRNGLNLLSDFLGIAYPPAALFLILSAAMLLILIQYSVVISRLTEANKALAQEVALLRTEVHASIGQPTAVAYNADAETDSTGAKPVGT